MKLRTKLTRDGNSWAVRLPKHLREASGLKPGTAVILRAKPGRIIIYSAAAAKLASRDKYEAAKQDAREAWDKAFEEVWFDIFGIDE